MSLTVARFAGVQPAAGSASGTGLSHDLDPESRAWLADLRADGAQREEAIGRLHELLLRAARFESHRRRGQLRYLRDGELDEITHESAADALVAVLGRLDDFRGLSRFTTWAYKFALLETAVKIRRRGWQARELPRAPEDWETVPDLGGSPAAEAEQSELIAAVRDAVATALTPHQRDVLVAIALNDVPIDVLAERLNTTRGPLYKTVHDARRKLRATLAAEGFELGAGGDSR